MGRLPEWMTVGWRADGAVAGTLVVLLAWGVVLVLAGAAAGHVVTIGVGGGLAGAALVGLLAGGWVDGLVLVALALPLPAVLGEGSPRIPPAAIVTAVVVFAWLLGLGLNRRPLRVDVLPLKSILFLGTGFLIAAVFATHRGAALREVINLGSLLGLLVVATHELAEDRDRMGRLSLVIAVTAAAGGVVAALQMVGSLPTEFPRSGTSFYRATLGFGWPNEAAMFFALCIPFVVHVFGSARTLGARALAALGVVLCVLGLVATFSRGSWLAVLAAPAVFLFVGKRRRAVGLWLWAFPIILIIDVGFGGIVVQRAVETIGDWVLAQRLALMFAGILMFLDHPIVGVGPGGFPEVLESYATDVAWLWDFVGSAHNAYIHMAAETGLLGLTGLLAFIAATFGTLLRGARRVLADPSAEDDDRRSALTALWAFSTAILVSMVEWSFAHGVGQLIMLIAALGFASELRRLRTRP